MADISSIATTAGALVPGPVGTGLKILGGLGGLFGDGGVNNSQYNDAMRNTNNNAGRLSDLRDWYGKNAAQQTNYYNTDNAAARTAAGDLESYYKTDPNNDAAYTRDLARANSGLHENIAKAQFQNLANAGSNGSMVPGGALSGSGSGINAYLSAMDALGTSQNQVNVANTNQARRVSNMQSNYNLTNGMAEGDLSNANQATGNESGLTTQLMNFYNNQAQEALGQEQAAGGAEMSGLAGLGGNIGGLLSGFGHKKKSVSGGTTGVNLPSGYGLNIPQFGGSM